MLLVGSGCAAAQRGEGLDVGALPAEVRDDYELFAHRCSRCHTLARPLSARVSDMDHWRSYVARMRRQPGSGITAEDEPGILRFLAWYTANRRTVSSGAGGFGGDGAGTRACSERSPPRFIMGRGL